jgi:hypothetical protein
MPSIHRWGRVLAGLAPVLLTLVLAGCADDRPASRNTPLQPGTQGSGEPDFALLWNAGPETARLSDELAAFVSRAFIRAAGEPLRVPATGGVLQQVTGGGFAWTPGAAGTPIEVRTFDGRVLTLTAHSGTGGFLLADPFGLDFGLVREALVMDWSFDVEIEEPGVIDVRITQAWLPANDPRLDGAQSVSGWQDEPGFERTITGILPRGATSWTTSAVHRGVIIVASHGSWVGESLSLSLEAPGQQYSAETLVGLNDFHSFHTGQGGYTGWRLAQTSSHVVGGETWSIAGANLLGGYFRYAGYATPVVPDDGGWEAGGELHRNGGKIGRFAFAALVQPGTLGEPVVAMQGGVFEVVQPAGRPAPVSLFDDPFIED